MTCIAPASPDLVMHLAHAAKAHLIRIRPGVPTWAVRAGGEVVGCAQVWRVGAARWRLDGCYIQPEQRGKGYGNLLVAARLAWAAAHHPGVVLDTYAFRPALFLRLGWSLRRSYAIGTHWLECRIGTTPAHP